MTKFALEQYQIDAEPLGSYLDELEFLGHSDEFASFEASVRVVKKGVNQAFSETFEVPPAAAALVMKYLPQATSSSSVAGSSGSSTSSQKTVGAFLNDETSVKRHAAKWKRLVSWIELVYATLLERHVEGPMLKFGRIKYKDLLDFKSHKYMSKFIVARELLVPMFAEPKDDDQKPAYIKAYGTLPFFTRLEYDVTDTMRDGMEKMLEAQPGDDDARRITKDRLKVCVKKDHW
mmetsp:Transcript_44577/g.108052  ORF Transcript_44577/g.108052 Transcript_44577/m.108052 type:complete len:233 (+) Transcript_44577:651-1349(+)